MRKIFAFLFWILISILSLLSVLFLIYLICQTFELNVLGDFYAWLFKILTITPVGTDLGTLWIIYLVICIPCVAILQAYGHNLANKNVSFPLLTTVVKIIGGFLEIILAIALLCGLIYLLKKFGIL